MLAASAGGAVARQNKGARARWPGPISTGARTEGESLIIVSQTTTWLSTLASVSYSAVTYTKSCFTFQLKTERRSASMPSVRTAWS